MRPGCEWLQRPPSPVGRTRVAVKAVFRTERTGHGSASCVQCRSARDPDTSEARSGGQHHVSRRHCTALPVRRPQRPPGWEMGPSQEPQSFSSVVWGFGGAPAHTTGSTGGGPTALVSPGSIPAAAQVHSLRADEAPGGSTGFPQCEAQRLPMRFRGVAGSHGPPNLRQRA